LLRVASDAAADAAAAAEDAAEGVLLPTLPALPERWIVGGSGGGVGLEKE